MAAFGGDDIEMDLIGVSGPSDSAGVISVIEQSELTSVCWSTRSNLETAEECTEKENLAYASSSEDHDSTASRKDSTSTGNEPSPSPTPSAALALGERDIELGLSDVSGPSGFPGVDCVMKQKVSGKCRSSASNFETDEEFTGSESLPYMSASEGDISSAAGREDSASTCNEESSPKPSVAFPFGDRYFEMGLEGVPGASGFPGVDFVMKQKVSGKCRSSPSNFETDEEFTGSESLPYMSSSEGDISSAASREGSASTCTEESSPRPSVAFPLGDGYFELGLEGVPGSSGLAGVSVMEYKLTDEYSSTSTNTTRDEENAENESVPYRGKLGWESDDSSIGTRKDSTRRHNEPCLSPPTRAVALDLLRSALDNAESVISSSRATIKAVEEAVIIAKKRERTALKLSEMDDSNRNSLFYRKVANRYNRAVSCVTQRHKTLEAKTSTAEEAVEIAATYTCTLAPQPSEDADSAVSAKYQEETIAAYVAANTINSAVLQTRINEFRTLRAIGRCWVEIDYHAGGNVIIDPRNVTIYGANCDPKNIRIHYAVYVVMCILGFSIIGISMLLRESTGSFIALLIFGNFLVVFPIISLVHTFKNKYLKAREEAQRKKTREVVATVTNKLIELETYFLANNISLILD